MNSIEEQIELLNDRDVRFRGWNCILKVGRYSNGNIALSLYNKHDFEPVSTASVNIQHIKLDADEVFIKDYMENQGVYNSLVEADIIYPEAIKTHKIGFVIINSYKLKLDE